MYLADAIHTFKRVKNYSDLTTWRSTIAKYFCLMSRFIFSPLPSGAAYIRVLIFYYHFKHHRLKMLKIKYEIY